MSRCLVPVTITTQIIKGRRPFKMTNDTADLREPAGRSVDRLCQRACYSIEVP